MNDEGETEGRGDDGLAGDRVRLNNMVFYGYHGAFQAERELGHRLEVDIELQANLEKAARSDEVEFSTNYADIYALVREVLEEHQYCLLESIARAVVTRLLAAYDFDAVRVRIRTPAPALGGLLDSIEVEMGRGRKDLAVMD